MTKFIKTLIVINGLIIPIGIVIFLGVVLFSLIQNSFSHTNSDSINLNNTITDNGDTLIKQGLRYYGPEPISNSNNFLIKIMAKNYENPSKIGSSYERESYFNQSYLNILFLDNDYNVISRLIDKKGYITSFTIPSSSNEEEIDTTIKNIGYLIAFEDSNNDNKLDETDNSDLYISDLNGKELTQVTREVDVIEFRFINKNKELFITYKDRTDIKDEYKRTRFEIYNITSGHMSYLTGIDKALDGIQKILY